jgi:hypothetical protein
MRMQIVKPQPPKNHVSAQHACDSSCVGRAGVNLQHIWVLLWVCMLPVCRSFGV